MIWFHKLYKKVPLYKLRCIACGKLSFSTLCLTCKEDLAPRVHKRVLDDKLVVYSFFGYNDIAPLLHTKHHSHGAFVFKALAKLSFLPFIEQLNLQDVCFLPIDDHTRNGYSHTAILARVLKKAGKVYFNSLRAKNKISYSGKSLTYRKSHPRGFTCKLRNKNNIILVDDLVTSGITLLEAKKNAEKSNNSILFALTLANAKVK